MDHDETDDLLENCNSPQQTNYRAIEPDEMQAAVSYDSDPKNILNILICGLGDYTMSMNLDSIEYYKNGKLSQLQGSGNIIDTLDELPAGIGQYEDFHTIDWLREIARDRMRHRHILKKRQEGLWEQIKSAHDAWSGWVCVFLVGLAAGTCAGFIDIGASWMTDLKEGVCFEAFWFNKEQCCWSGPSLNSTSMDDNKGCAQVI